MSRYEKFRKFARVAQIIAALILTILIIVRFINMGGASPIDFILTFYYIFFVATIFLSELGVKVFMKRMYFMYYSWGKAAFNIFVGSLCLTTSIVAWLHILVGVLFMVSGVVFLILGCCCFREEEKERINEETGYGI